MLDQLTLSAGVAPVLTMSRPAAVARHYFAGVGVPDLLVGQTANKCITYITFLYLCNTAISGKLYLCQ